jgi:hypothetical protein
MNHHQVATELRLYINSMESSMFLFRMKDKFSISINLVEEQITSTIAGKKLEKFDEAIVQECVEYLTRKMIESPKREKSYYFVNQFVLFILEWNNNLLKSSELTNKLMRLLRFVGDSMRLYERLQVLDKLVDNLNFTNTWVPPSFELSEHYFNLIKGE